MKTNYILKTALFVATIFCGLTLIACGSKNADFPYSKQVKQEYVVPASQDKMMAFYISDTAFYSFEKNIDETEKIEFVCHIQQPLQVAPEWKDNPTLSLMVDYYNASQFYHSMSSDMHTALRYEDDGKDLVPKFKALDLSTINDKEIRKFETMCRDNYVALINSNDDYWGLQGATIDSIACTGLNKYLIANMPQIDTSINYDELLSPKHWFSNIYRDFTSKDTMPTEKQKNWLFDQMMHESDFDTRAVQLFALCGLYLSSDTSEIVLHKTEEMMESGIYSPLLPLLWRAYRVLYNDHYACPSTFCYSPNLRYNHYRRLVAHTILRHINEHPDDNIAYMLFHTLSFQPNILRFGYFPYGNQSAAERILLYWQGEYI